MFVIRNQTLPHWTTLLLTFFSIHCFKVYKYFNFCKLNKMSKYCLIIRDDKFKKII